MKNRKSKRLVIDASIAQASGERSEDDPRSRHCRELLQAILTICHQITMSPGIAEEWKQHQSKFTRIWRYSMEARKKICRVDALPDEALRSRVLAVASSEKDKEAMLKDLHLIEAALATDKIVISIDATAQGLFHSSSAKIGTLRDVVWVNPEKMPEQILSWLEDGAPLDSTKTFKLGVEDQSP